MQRPISLAADIRLSSALEFDTIRLSSRASESFQIQDKQACVLIGQGVRFPSWNPVLMPVLVEVDETSVGVWAEVSAELSASHIVDMGQPWDLVPADVVDAEEVEVTIDEGVGSRSRRESVTGRRVVGCRGTDLRVEDRAYGRQPIIDSSGVWPLRVTGLKPIPRRLTIFRITEKTDVRHIQRNRQSRGQSVVFLVDCSGSMDDVVDNDVATESPLTRARNLLADVVATGTKDGLMPERCAIVGYGATVARVFPETHQPLAFVDRTVLTELNNAAMHLHPAMLDELGIRRHLSDMPLALLYAGHLLTQAEDLSDDRIIILISDGESEPTYETPDEIGTTRVEKSQMISRALAEPPFLIQISTVYVGNGPASAATTDLAPGGESDDEATFNEDGLSERVGATESGSERLAKIAQGAAGQVLDASDRSRICEIISGMG